MTRLQTSFRQKLLLALGALLNVGAIALAAFSFVRGEFISGLWWVAVAVGWLLVLRMVLGTSESIPDDE